MQRPQRPWHAVKWLLLCTVICTAQPTSTALASVHFRQPTDYGVQHFQFLGSTKDKQEHGIMHILVKIVREGNRVAMRGTGVFESLSMGSLYRSHPSFEESPPEMVLEGQQKGSSWHVQLQMSQHHPGIPFHVQAEFEDENYSFAMKIIGWERWAVIRPLFPEEFIQPIDGNIAGAPKYTIDAKKQKFDRSHAPVVGIISPMHINQAVQYEEFPSIVAFHVKYHLRLGYNLFMLYVRPNMEIALAENKQIQDLVHNNRLVIITWNPLPFHADHPYYDQELVYNHAATVFWGHNVWLNTIDIDEFIGANEPLRNVRQILTECATAESDFVRLKRWQYDCPSCRDSWFAGISGDIMHWQKRAVPDPLKLYTKAGPFDDYGGGGKYFLNPNVACAITPHNADLLPGALPEFQVDEKCAYIGHMVNLIHVRQTKEGEHFDRQNTWWWITADTDLVYAGRDSANGRRLLAGPSGL